jgi:hypothetical protein
VAVSGDSVAVVVCWVNVSFIEELHRKKVKAGESFGAAYVVGWFDDVAEMEKVYDKFKGKRSIVVEDGKFRLE